MPTALCVGPIVAGIHLCLASLVAGGLFIESFPRQPQKSDQVTLRCYAVPAKTRLHRDCHYQWEMTPNDDDEESKDERRMQTRRPAASGSRILDPVTNIDAYSDSGTMILINELQEEHEGRYDCRFLCVGRRTESAFVYLEIGKETGADAKSQNTKIAYVSCGIVFVVIVLVTALRLSCSSESRCSSSSPPSNSRRNTPIASSRNSETTAQFHLSWIETLSTNSSASSSTRNKPKESHRRPTILANTVWLPPYEAAIKYSRVLSGSSTSGCSPSAERRLVDGASTDLPTYDEALVLLRQGSSTAPDGDPLPSSPSEETNTERRISTVV